MCRLSGVLHGAKDPSLSPLLLQGRVLKIAVASRSIALNVALNPLFQKEVWTGSRRHSLSIACTALEKGPWKTGDTSVGYAQPWTQLKLSVDSVPCSSAVSVCCDYHSLQNSKVKVFMIFDRTVTTDEIGAAKAVEH